MPTEPTTGTVSEAVMPDGRQLAAPHAEQAGYLWRAVCQDPYYAAGVAGLSAGDVVLDIGANIGLTTLKFVDTVPGLRVIAVEPAPATAECLRRNLARYAPGAEAVQAAVGAEPGTMTFTYYPESPANSTLYADFADTVRCGRRCMRNMGMPEEYLKVHDETLPDTFGVFSESEVDMVTVDQLIARYQLSRVALLKIDVERAELDVLRGISEANWPRIGRVVAEVHDQDGRLDEVLRLLTARGLAPKAEQEPLFAGTNLHMVVATSS